MESPSLSLEQQFGSLKKRYDQAHSAPLPPISETYHNELESLVDGFKSIWKNIRGINLWSSNDQLDDILTSSLGYACIPYFLGNIHKRSRCSFEDDHSLEQRVTNLTISSGYFREQIELCSSFEMITDDEVNKFSSLSSLKRMDRIDLQRRLMDADEQILKSTEILSRKVFLEQRRKRFVEMGALSDDETQTQIMDDGVNSSINTENEVCDSAFSDAERNSKLASLWKALWESFIQLDLNQKEIELLSYRSSHEISSKKDSEELEKDRQCANNRSDKGIYTIFPGGNIMVGPSKLSRDGLYNAQNAESCSNMFHGIPSVLSQAHNTVTFREKVRNEVFMDRNPPTMSLNDFAELEINDLLQRTERQKTLKQKHDTLMSSLTLEEQEDLKRLEEGNWNNWKDDNPSVGITSKGNYS